MNQKGFSLLEVILAAAIFVTLASAATVTIISGLDINRLGNEVTIGNQYTAEAMEAVRSIRNQSWTTFSAKSGLGNQGLVLSGGVWTFSGTSNTLASDTRFTRSVVITDVQRDVSGNIVASGGTDDPNTKKVTATTSWNFNAARPESVVSSTYLTDWKAPIGSQVGQGLLVYDDGSTTPQFRIYDAGSFGSATGAAAGASGRFFSMRTSPTKTEAIAAYVTSAGTLRVMCFDGSSWSDDWAVGVGGTGTTRRFDIAYETNSGDVMVIYSRNGNIINGVAYRTKSGSSGCGAANWSAGTNFAVSPAATSGTVHWVRMARDPRSSSNNLTVIWADSNADLGVNNWSGSAWATTSSTYKVLETSLEVLSAAQDVDNFEVVYESVSGNVMVVWGNSAGANGTNGARYSRCTGGTYTCTWTGAAAVNNVTDDVHNIDMTANPDTDQIVYAAIGNAGDDLTAAYWSGSGWTGYANLDNSAESPIAGSRKVSTAWLINGSATRWILNYDDANGTNLSWYAASPGSTPSKQTDFSATPSINDIRHRYDADFDPVNKNEAMVTLSDSTMSIFAKKASMDGSGAITWANADGGASLGTTTEVPHQGFTFQYWRSP